MEDLVLQKKIRDAIRRNPRLDFVPMLLSSHKNADVFLVGGTLRDILLDRPSKDVDLVVCTLSLSDAEAWLQSHGEVDIAGKTFGVLKFSPQGSQKGSVPIDIALPRTETPTKNSQGGYREFEIQSDPALPIASDLARRDFTMNAMAYSLRDDRLVDPFGGFEAIKKKEISAVGLPADRFREDLTRILRGVRFACELGFSLSSPTLLAMQELAPHINDLREDGTPIVAREMVGLELSKAFYASPSTALALLAETGLLIELFPELNVHGEALTQYLEPAAQEHLSATAVLALLLRDVPAEKIKALLAQKGFHAPPHSHPARIDPDAVASIVRELQTGIVAQGVLPESYAEFERRFMTRRSDDLLRALSALGKTELVDAITRKRKEIYNRFAVQEGEDIPELISGSDLTSLGFKPGPIIRTLLDQARDAQLSGELMTRDAVLNTLRKSLA